MKRVRVAVAACCLDVLLLSSRGVCADRQLSAPVDSTRADTLRSSKPTKIKTPKPNVLRPLKVSGYIQVHYRYSRATGADSSVDNDNFRVQRVRVGVEGDVNQWVSYDVEIDPRSPEITGVLRDAYITLKIIPRHKIRIGQQKTQFGYENNVSSTELFAVNRAEVSDALSRGINLRDIGVGLIGNLKLGGGMRLEDAITVVNGAGLNVQDDNTPRKNVFGRVGARWKSDARDFVIRFGVSGASGDIVDLNDPANPADDLHTAFQRRGVDLELDHRRFFAGAEYVRGSEKDLTTGETDDPSGYYINLVGKTKWQIGPIIRYDAFADEFKRSTLGAYYGLPAAPFRVMLNYEVRQRINDARGDDKVYVWTQVRF